MWFGSSEAFRARQPRRVPRGLQWVIPIRSEAIEDGRLEQLASAQLRPFGLDGLPKQPGVAP